MKIDVNKIPPDGLILAEGIASSELDLDTELIKFCSPLKVEADVSKITNVVTAHLKVAASMYVTCSRCLNEFEAGFKKEIELNYPVNKSVQSIDFNPDIREEIILDYPINPLCNQKCKGLCLKCGKNLNEGGCSCGST